MYRRVENTQTNSADPACHQESRPVECASSLRTGRCSMTVTPPRLHRSELAVPGSNVRMLEKAPQLGADIVMLDLEDAVAPADKPPARPNVVDALREQDWSGCYVSLRINGLDTHWCYRDLVDVVEVAGAHLDQ